MSDALHLIALVAMGIFIGNLLWWLTETFILDRIHERLNKHANSTGDTVQKEGE